MDSKLIRNEIVIDWKDALFSVLKKWWLILLCFILGAGSGYGLGVLADTPVYNCQAVYVLSYSGGNTVNDMSSEYSFLTRIINNCVEIVKQNTFMEIIADDINEGVDVESEDYIDADALAKCITYPESSKTVGTLIYVNVDTGDPALSYKIIRAVTDHLPTYIVSQYGLAGGDSMVFSLVNTPMLPDEPVESRTRIMFTAIGALAFAFIMTAILAFVALLDNRIKKEDDLKNKYNAPILGTVPNFYDPEIYKEGYYQYGSNRK